MFAFSARSSHSIEYALGLRKNAPENYRAMWRLPRSDGERAGLLSR